MSLTNQIQQVKNVKNDKVTVEQILREATMYVEGRVLRRALVSFGFIILFGVIALVLW